MISKTKNQDIEIRLSEPRDLQEVCRLYEALLNQKSQGENFCCWTPGIYPTRETAEIACLENSLWLLWHKGVLAASVILNHDVPEAYAQANWSKIYPADQVLVVHTLAVHPKFEGRGLASRLLDHAQALASKAGYGAVWLDTPQYNIPAQRLYEKNGFQYTGMVDLGYSLEGMSHPERLHEFRCYERLVFCWSDLRADLEELADSKLQGFSERLTPDSGGILGVRLPLLRKTAARLAQGDVRAVLASACDGSFEETLLQGMILGLANMELPERLERIAAFVPKITNWATCDASCATYRFAQKHRQEVFEFLYPYLQSDREFDCRFAVVMLLNHFLTQEYVEQVLDILEEMRHPGYYSRMAVAWAVSACYIKFPNPTMAMLERRKMEPWTWNKALQKIVESRQVKGETKQEIRAMKQKAGTARSDL